MLTVEEIIYAAVLALFITWVVLSVSKIFKITGKPLRLAYNPEDLDPLLEKCYLLFPNEKVSFRGKTFTRGMNVRITTNRQKTYEGRLIGLNSSNIMCVLTAKQLVAHELDKIIEMITMVYPD